MGEFSPIHWLIALAFLAVIFILIPCSPILIAEKLATSKASFAATKKGNNLSVRDE